jgi:hypothetical protein
MSGKLIVCDVTRLPADMRTVDALARLQLQARRQGLQVELEGATPDLLDLLELAGLADGFERPRTRAGGAAETAGTGGRCRERR